MNYAQISPKQFLSSLSWIIPGAFLAAFALETILVPNKIIDGGVVGISILISEYFGDQFLYPCVFLLNMPFIFLAYRNIARSFVLLMFLAVTSFSIFGSYIAAWEGIYFHVYRGDLLEIVVIGGILLGLGVGMIIRSGACLDGTEILGILISKRYGFSVGTIVMAINIFIFSLAGFIYNDWHTTIQSVITFFIVMKVMDMVIVGLDEMKSVMIFSPQTETIAEMIMQELGLGLTYIQGKGGYTGDERKIIYVIAERLQLSALKDMVHQIDPNAVVVVNSLHEVSTQDLKRLASKARVSPTH